MSSVRARWAAVGAAVAVTLGAGVTTQHFVSAAGPTLRPVLVSITPCRLADTRSTDQVGPRATPIGSGEALTVVAHGTNGRCTIPSDAVALSLNVTALNATRSTFLTIWARGDARPASSSLNPSPGAPPTPNAVTVSLGSGAFDIYNQQGSVDVIVDVNGYYVAHDHDDRYYTKAAIDAALVDKATADDVYLKSEVDALVAAADTTERIVIVTGGGTAAENGASLVSAIGTVTTAAPTATTPWKILLEPGRYEAASFPALPAYTTLSGSGRGATHVRDTNEGPAITATGFVTITDLTVSQAGTSSAASFTDDVELHQVRVVTGSSSFAAAGLSITGAGAEARLTDVLVDDGDPTVVIGNLWGMSVNDGATAELIDSDVDNVYGALVVGYLTPATVTVRNTRLDANSSSMLLMEGTVSIDASVLTQQIALGNSTDDVVDLEVRNTAMNRVFFNGTGTTGARSVVIEGSTMSGGIDGGAGDGATSAVIRSTSMDGTVSADSETCVGISGPTAFFATTCP